jgi:hypothetical protein
MSVLNDAAMAADDLRAVDDMCSAAIECITHISIRHLNARRCYEYSQQQ